MVLKVKTTITDVKDLDQENGHIDDQGGKDRRQGHIVKDHVNAIAIGKEIEMEGE